MTDNKQDSVATSDKQHCVKSLVRFCYTFDTKYAYQGDEGDENDSALHKLFMAGELGHVLIVDYPEITSPAPLTPISPPQPNHTPIQGIAEKKEF